MLITRLLARLGLSELLPNRERPAERMSDSARAALSIYQHYGSDIYRTLRESDHGQHLIELGFEADILAASQLDSVALVPLLEQMAIKKKLIFSESLRKEIEDDRQPLRKPDLSISSSRKATVA
jgi:hypothetical protein